MIDNQSEKKLEDLLRTFTKSNFMELLRAAYHLGRQDLWSELELKMDSIRAMKEEIPIIGSGAV